MTASTESFIKMEKIDGFSHSRITPACLEIYPELARFGRALDLEEKIFGQSKSIFLSYFSYNNERRQKKCQQ